jgi:hypothetical protein
MPAMSSKSRFAQSLDVSSFPFLRPVLAAVVIASMVSAAAAQEFQTDPIDPQAKRHSGRVLGVVRNPAQYAADRAKVLEYFTGYYFPAMTQTDAVELAALGSMRYDLFRKTLWATNHEPLQRDLTEIAFAATRKIVGASNPPYHPAVRYNAVLILGQLDQQYAIEGANPRPPVPLPAATKLLNAIVSAAANDKPVPPPVTLGALIGLERHAKFREALEPGAADAITATLLKFLSREKPMQEMDRETYDWLRLRAATVLAQLGSPGPKNEVHDAILKLVAEFKNLDDRTAAAALLAKLKYEGAKLDGAATVEQLFALARDLGEAEAKRAEDFQEARLGGRSFGRAARGEMFNPSGPTGEKETFPRRHVLARFVDLRTALRAVKPAVAEELQARIDAVLKALQPAIAAAEDKKDTGELKLAAAVQTTANAIEREAAPAEKPAAEAEEKISSRPIGS